MELVNCMVALDGDRGNTVPRHKVTPAEILVLIAIHGEDAVFDIEPLDVGVTRSPREELMRLREFYATARNSDDELIVGNLFPGSGAPVPSRIEEIGLHETLFKPIERVKMSSKPSGKPKPKPNPLPWGDKKSSGMENPSEPDNVLG